MLTSIGRIAARRFVGVTVRSSTFARAAPSLVQQSRTVQRSFTVSRWLRDAAAPTTTTATSSAPRKSRATTSKKGTGSSTSRKTKSGSTKKAKKPKAAAAKKKKKTTRKVKPATPLTEKQQHEKQLRNLRKMALKEPKRLPENAWVCFTAQRAPRMTGSLPNRISYVKSEYHRLGQSELENLRAQAKENHSKNIHTRDEWIASQPPELIFMANRARRWLKKLSGSRHVNQLQDGRQPDKTTNPFSRFLKSNTTGRSSDNGANTLRQVATQWRNMSETEKKPWTDETQHIKRDSEVLRKEYRQKATSYWKEKGISVNQTFTTSKQANP